MQIAIPLEFTNALAYETGLHIGDGSMNFYSNHGLYSLRGDKIKDRQFFQEIIAPLYYEVYSAKVNLREWSDVCGFQISSDELVKFKESLGLPLGPKTEIQIPAMIMDDEEFQRECLRGLFETDGNVYLEPKNGRLYPRLEFSTTSKKLSHQVSRVLLSNKIPFSNWKQSYSNGWKDIYRTCIRGQNNLERWMSLIGLKHPSLIGKLAKLGLSTTF